MNPYGKKNLLIFTTYNKQVDEDKGENVSRTRLNKFLKIRFY